MAERAHCERAGGVWGRAAVPASGRVVKGGAQGKGNAGSMATGGQGGRWLPGVVVGRDAGGAAVVADGGDVGW